MAKHSKYKNITKRPAYRSWAGMKTRCQNPDYPEFHYYGGRGIKVCDRWQSSENFFDDMLATYEKGLTLDRIDPDGDYCPENCRWITQKAQQNNRTNNHRFTYKGLTLTLTEWAEKLGIGRSTLAQRYYVYNWSIERCLGGY